MAKELRGGGEGGSQDLERYPPTPTLENTGDSQRYPLHPPTPINQLKYSKISDFSKPIRNISLRN